MSIGANACALFVSRQKCLFARQAADEWRSAAVLRQEGPAQVLDGIAQMHQFPVKDRGNPIAALEKVAQPVVAVNDRDARRLGLILTQPSEGAMRHRMRSQRPALKSLPPEIDLAIGDIAGGEASSPTGERRSTPVKNMKRRQRIDEIVRESFAAGAVQRCVLLAAPRKRRIAVDAFAEKKRRAENGRVVARRERAWNRHRTSLQRAERLEFGHCAIGRKKSVRRPNPK